MTQQTPRCQTLLSLHIRTQNLLRPLLHSAQKYENADMYDLASHQCKFVEAGGCRRNPTPAPAATCDVQSSGQAPAGATRGSPGDCYPLFWMQTKEVLQAMLKDAKQPSFKLLRVDGGASRNNLLMQLQADAIQVGSHLLQL